MIASAPSSKSSRAVFSVMPTPPAAFSPLTTTKSGRVASTQPGQHVAQRAAPAAADDVADEQQLHDGRFCQAERRWRAAPHRREARGRRHPAGARGARASSSATATARRCKGVSLHRRGRASWSRSSAPTAPARRRCSRSSPASSSPDEGSVSHGAGEIGWVPQQPALYAKLTVAENLELFARLERVRRPGRDRRPDARPDRPRATARDDQVGTLSGGNRQRVNIAIGLLARARGAAARRAQSPRSTRASASASGSFILRLGGDGHNRHLRDAQRPGGRPPRAPADRARRRRAAVRRLAARARARSSAAAGSTSRARSSRFLHQRGH